jgi:manganese efflux pump family protein
VRCARSRACPRSRNATLLRILLFVLPLGLDTFAVAAVLGARGLPRRPRLRVSLLLSGFEMAMPLVGLLLGRALGHVVGAAADYIAIAVLAALGTWMLLHEDEGEEEKVGAFASGHGFVLIALGISVSLDELAIGLTIGLLQLSLWLAIVLIGAQAFLLSQLGLRVGARLNEALRERAEQLAGLALIGLALLVALEKLV